MARLLQTGGVLESLTRPGVPTSLLVPQEGKEEATVGPLPVGRPLSIAGNSSTYRRGVSQDPCSSSSSSTGRCEGRWRVPLLPQMAACSTPTRTLAHLKWAALPAVRWARQATRTGRVDTALPLAMWT